MPCRSGCGRTAAIGAGRFRSKGSSISDHARRLCGESSKLDRRGLLKRMIEKVDGAKLTVLTVGMKRGRLVWPFALAQHFVNIVIAVKKIDRQLREQQATCQ